MDLDALDCPKCGRRMRVIAVVRDPIEIRRVLEHIGERSDLAVPSRAWDPVPVPDWPDAPTDAYAMDTPAPDDWN